jgi:hypothetical protein
MSEAKFYSVASQRLLNTIIQKVIHGSFKYQLSGHYISSRTNGILYDTLIQIKRNIKGNIWHQILIKIDSIRTFLAGKIVRIFLIGIGFLVLAVSFIEWVKLYKIGKEYFSEITPDLIASIVLGLIALSKRK